MADTSSATLALLVASGLGIGGVSSAVTGVSAAHREAPTSSATGGLGSRSSASLPGITATGGGASIDPLGIQPIVAHGVALEGVVTVAPSAPLPIIFIRASGQAAAVIGSAGTLPGVTASGIGFPGERGTSSVSLMALSAERPYMASGGSGGPAATSTSAKSLYGVLASGTAIAPAGSTFTAVALHSGTLAPWTYSNFPFNSFATLNGVTLAAGAGGVFSLDSATDNGTYVQAYARMGVTDFGTSYRKRVERVYVGYRALDDLVLRVRVDGGLPRDYRLPGNLKTGVHGAHVKLGRGLEGRYWQFEVRNMEGHTFAFDTIECKPLRLGRRVGGNDA